MVGGEVGGDILVGRLLINTIFLGRKYPNKKTLCEPTTVMLIRIAIIVDAYVSIFVQKIKKKMKLTRYQSKKIHLEGSWNFEIVAWERHSRNFELVGYDSYVGEEG